MPVDDMCCPVFCVCFPLWTRSLNNTQVMYNSHEIGRSDEKEVLDVSVALYFKRKRMNDKRRAFLRELDAMIGLRSPHTVNVYGAVTSMPDRLVLVMELLSEGDLRTMLGNRDHPLSEQKVRQIIGDICAGMEFSHIKETVHGDLKSANVLLDGAGRVKVGVRYLLWIQNKMFWENLMVIVGSCYK